ncbi:MAG: Acetyl-CoA:oxalate CoA-transferase [Nitrospira sp.]|nr:Acetyl-CoA:oxalate CoA-transferase [Nitrospira sp.]
MGNDMQAHKKPLGDIKVLDFTHAAAGPYATMFLGDMGAEIIKIEKPKGGDGTRSMGRPLPMLGPKDSDYYVAINRNKKGMVLDLEMPEARELCRELAKKVDIVIQNFRPGVMERLGLGFDDLKKLRPGLIYCSISAFGPTGPWSTRPANDIIMQSVSGLMGVTGEVGGGPLRMGAPISDFASGLFALSGTLAALHAREKFPEGQHVQIAMLDAAFNMMAGYVPAATMLGHKIERVGRGHVQIVPYQAFMCGDNEYVMVGAFTREFWQRLCRALGHEEWITDPRFVTNPARLANRDILIKQLEEIFASKSSKEWIEILIAADVPNSPVYELHDAVHSEQAVHNGVLKQVGDPPVTVLRTPIRSDEWDNDTHTPAPGFGADTVSVLQQKLGLDDDRIQQLRAKGVFGVQKEKK